MKTVVQKIKSVTGKTMSVGIVLVVAYLFNSWLIGDLYSKPVSQMSLGDFITIIFSLIIVIAAIKISINIVTDGVEFY